MLPKNHTHTRRDWLRDIIGLTLLFAVFYTVWLGSYPLFTPDEGRYTEVAREMVASGDYITPRVNGVAFLDKPVLYYWLQALAINLFGIKEWAIRLFPVLLGILCCLVTYLTGYRLFNRHTGIVAAAILATSPLYFGSAHYANLDLEVAALTSCTLLCFVMACHPSNPYRRYDFLAAYTFAALAFLTKGLIGIAFPAMIGGSWLLALGRLQQLKKMHLAAGISLFCCLVLPWYILVQQANPEFLHFFFITQQVSRFLSTESFNNPTPIWFYVPVILAGCFPWTAFMAQAIYTSCQRVFRNRHAHTTELYLLLWLVIVFGFFSVPHSKTVGYILPVFPPLALLIGHYLTANWNNARAVKMHWSIAIFVATSLLCASLLLLAPSPDDGWAGISTHFATHLSIVAITLIASALLSLLLLTQRTFLLFFSLCLCTSVIGLLVITHGAAKLNQNTAKPLVTQLQTILTPEDEVINYFKFYHDVPLYLEQRITLVADWQAPDIAKRDNWVRELWYGMPFQHTEAWLINEDVFWQRFNSKKRVFVFLNSNYFDKFKAHHGHYYIVAMHNDIILLSNQPYRKTHNLLETNVKMGKMVSTINSATG